MSVRQTSNNVLIIKDDIGKAKRTTRDLPPSDFTYGLVVAKDPVGVQERK
jgi:hypothetical protein